MLKIADLESKFKKSVEHFKKDLAKVRTGRASTSILDGLQVEYYGSMVPLIQLGMINAPEPRQITIQVYDSAAMESIEKAILQADLGLNPSRDGGMIRINIPSLTEDRRKELVKKLHKMTEDARVLLRNIRRDANDEVKKLEKDKAISADDSRRNMDDIQKLTDRYIKELDQMLTAKEKEILEV